MIAVRGDALAQEQRAEAKERGSEMKWTFEKWDYEHVITCNRTRRVEDGAN
jgi:hypothetical protein